MIELLILTTYAVLASECLNCQSSITSLDFVVEPYLLYGRFFAEAKSTNYLPYGEQRKVPAKSQARNVTLNHHREVLIP